MRTRRWVMIAIPVLAGIGSLILDTGPGEIPKPGVRPVTAQQMPMGGKGQGGKKEMKMGAGHMPMGRKQELQGPIHITRPELHEGGGVPPGWYFRVPAGDPEAGQEVFITMKCYTCHDVEGEKFPVHQRDVGDVGPDLTGMGPMHPAEYFAETVLNPSAVVITGEGFAGPDGLSKMPDYLDTLTLRDWVDLTAYLKGLKGGAHGGGMDKGMHKN